MVLESELKVFLSGIPEITKKDGELKKNTLKCGDEDQDFVGRNGGVKIVDEKWISENGANVNVYEAQSNVKGRNGDGDDDWVSDGDPSSRKRKRKCYLDLLNWICKVAKNPCNPVIGSLPERQKWKYYGREQLWKKILFVREAMLLKGNIDASSQQSIWQKKQKMHPSMYYDHSGSERLRCSQRLLFAKDSSSKRQERFCSESSSSNCQSDEHTADKESDSAADSVGFWGNFIRQKRIPIGPHFQADVPKYYEAAYESDSKWLGTPFWPLEKGEQNKNLIERDPIGKGRQESCGCQFPGSLECVKFHVGEKRMKVKLELGSAFYRWKFEGMGEEVALSWSKEDENKFQDIVKSNRLSSEKYFWDELFKFFPSKGREALVSYYFNVFLLRCRGHQNRNTTSNIHSDDEESEFGPIGNRFGQMAAISRGSIFCSPKKSHLNRR